MIEQETRNLKGPDIVPFREVGRGDLLFLIVKTADRVDADVIILGTHGKAGTAAFWSGSIAARLAKQTLRPLLLIPV